MKSNVNKIVILGFVAGCLAVLTFFTSYAVWNWNSVGAENKISTGSVSIKYLESNDEIISISNALPMDDAAGKVQGDKFAFSVTSAADGNRKIQYSLIVNKLTPDTGYTFLNDNQIKIYLEDYDTSAVLVSERLISSLTNYQLYTTTDTIINSASVTKNYRLRVWIDSSVEAIAKTWTKSTKLQYKFKIDVSSKEI